MSSKLLLAHPGVDTTVTDADDHPPLLASVISKSLPVIETLLADPRHRHQSPRPVRLDRPAVRVRAGGSNTPLIKLLLERGADVNAKDNAGWTPLMWAAHAGSAEIARMLLEVKNVDVNVQCDKGRTALSRAAEKPCLEIVTMLLEREDLVDMDVEDEDGRSAMFYAALRGEVAEPVMRRLAEKGAKTTTKDKRGNTLTVVLAEEGDEGYNEDKGEDDEDEDEEDDYVSSDSDVDGNPR